MDDLRLYIMPLAECSGYSTDLRSKTQGQLLTTLNSAGLADRYNRLLRMLGKDMVERLVQDDIRMQAELEAKKQKEQMPKK